MKVLLSNLNFEMLKVEKNTKNKNITASANGVECTRNLTQPNYQDRG